MARAAAAAGWGLRALLTGGGLVVVAFGLLALRLAAGPIDVTGLARHFAGHWPGGGTLTMSHAALGWRVWPAPSLEIRADGLVLRRGDESVDASAGQLRVSLLPAALLAGRVRPVAVTLVHASLALRHTAAGGIALDDGRPAGAADNHVLARLRAVDATDIAATLADPASALPWQMSLTRLTLRDIGRPTVSGAADADVANAGQSTRISATLASGGMLKLGWTALDLSRVPAAKALGAPDVAVAGNAQILLNSDGQWRTAAATLTLGPGHIRAAAGSVAIAGGSVAFTADSAAHTAHLLQARLALPAGSDGHAPILHLAGTAHWGAARAEGGLAADLDHIALADLARYWPAGAAASGRAWMLANAPAGTATQAHLDLTLAADHGAITLTSVTGHLQAADLTLAWLAPIPPLSHVAARLLITSPDALTVEVARGVQSPSETADRALLLGPSTLRITGLAGPVQLGTIDATLNGPVAQAVALLRENRMHLLARHPIELGVASGLLSAHVQISLPLNDAVTIDQIGIRATGTLSALHLGGVMAGRDVDDGQITFSASGDGMTMGGTAQLAGIAASLSVAMDFRAGGPLQTINTYAAHGTASAAALQAAGLPAAGSAAGAIDYDGRFIERRNGSGQIDLHADLRSAAVSLAALGWQKTAGQDGSAQVRVLLDHGRLAGIDDLAITAPGIDIQGHASVMPGQPVVLALDPLRIGATQAAGTLRFPTRADPGLVAALHGSVLDLGPALKGQGARPALSRRDALRAAERRRVAAGAASRGMPWAADLHFDRVLTGDGRALDDITAHARNDGLVFRRAQITGQAGTGRFSARLAPGGAGRSLVAQAQDAGGLMAALDLTGALRGGTLALNAAYDDTLPDHPLSGTVTIDKFSVVGAVAVAKLLQAITLYGVVDVLRGPGLAITHLQAPFRLANQVLMLNEARAFSSSLGFTAKGDVDLAAQRADLAGTVVPGYFFNTLPGKIPLIGKLFSPEKGGGVFAATWQIAGPLAKPAVTLNPLAALAPGFLRDVLGNTNAKPSADSATSP